MRVDETSSDLFPPLKYMSLHQDPAVVYHDGHVNHFFPCWALDCATAALPGLAGHTDPLGMFPGVCWGCATGRCMADRK